MIYVSFPRGPNDWLSNSHWHSQLSHFVFHGLRKRFGDGKVEFVAWDKIVECSGSDLIVTFLPNVNYRTGARIIGVENDTLIPSRWRQAHFDCHGIHARVDDISELFDLYRQAVGLMVMTNDVALRRLASGESEALSHAEQLSNFCGGNIHFGPHPIDKDRFRRVPKKELNRKKPWSLRKNRLMIYHAGWRKNSAETIALLEENELGRGKKFDVVNHIDKDDYRVMRRLVKNYNIIFSGSFSESGPINLIEYLIQGFVVAGHEAWWSGYDFPETVWSYDSALRHLMVQRLTWLLDDANIPLIQDHRDRILRYFMSRRDMEWDHYLDKLAEIIRRAL